MITLSAEERKLLHQCYPQLGHVIASPEHGVDHLAQSLSAGCGRGFSYRATRASLAGEWSHYEVVERLKDGTPSRLEFDAPHLRLTITMTRLRQWARGLPGDLRSRAQTAWATETRNLGELWAIVHEAIDLSAPAEQLELFEVA